MLEGVRGCWSSLEGVAVDWRVLKWLGNSVGVVWRVLKWL